jgi:hypothetical protein
VTFSVENEPVVKDLIINQTAEKWPDITLIDVEVKAIMEKREWYIRIMAQDKTTKLIMTGDTNISGDNTDE